jgi:hypothetical protein
MVKRDRMHQNKHSMKTIRLMFLPKCAHTFETLTQYPMLSNPGGEFFMLFCGPSLKSTRKNLENFLINSPASRVFREECVLFQPSQCSKTMSGQLGPIDPPTDFNQSSQTPQGKRLKKSATSLRFCV